MGKKRARRCTVVRKRKISKRSSSSWRFLWIGMGLLVLLKNPLSATLFVDLMLSAIFLICVFWYADLWRSGWIYGNVWCASRQESLKRLWVWLMEAAKNLVFLQAQLLYKKKLIGTRLHIVN